MITVKLTRLPNYLKITAMYYLWKDKRSTENKLITYITDYKEVRNDGKVQIDGKGYINAELVHSSENKIDCIAFATKLMEQ